MAKKALGKGLEALIPHAMIDSLQSEKIIELGVDEIEANRFQPRKDFDREKIDSLAKSIAKDGVLQPLVVRRTEAGYELIMGERRWRAAKAAGLATVPVIVKDAADADALRLALVENLQRENLNAMDVAEAYKRLVESFDMTLSELAGLIGKDLSSVSNTMRLLNLPEEVKEMVRAGKLTEGHARAVLSVGQREEQIRLAREIVERKMSVRATEAAAGEARKNTRSRRTTSGQAKKEKPAHITFLEEAVSKHLGTRVTIEEKRGGKGRIIIEFYSHEDFERLAELMNIPLPR